VPALWPFAVANVLALAERRQRISQRGIGEFVGMELAKREGMLLATLDHDLREAGVALGVAIVEVP